MTEVLDEKETSWEETYAEAEAEGTQEALIAELAQKDEVTVDDLRRLPGTEGKSDEEVLAQWEEVSKTKTEAETKVELPFPVYDAQGNKVPPDKVTLEALFKGELQIGYQALGKEQRKALQDVIRNASQGHWNEHRYTTVQSQLSQSLKELQSLKQQTEQFETERKQWNAALTALIAGDKEPMQRLVDAYQQALTTTGAVPSGFVPESRMHEEIEATQAGMRWMQEVALPVAIDIGSKVNVHPKEVMAVIEQTIQNEPMLTRERLDEILKFDVPMAFEGKSQKAPAVDEVAELKKTVAELQKRIAEGANATTQRIKTKVQKAPSPGSGATSGAGDAMPNFKSRAQMKAWTQGDPDWAKA